MGSSIFDPTMTAPPASLARALDSRYRLDREIGHGGMSFVYLALDIKHGRQVAVKVLHSDLAASIGAERFLREIRIAAGLAHPHILPLIDSGDAGGFLYYVTPYVPDGSLRSRLDQGTRLSLNDTLRIVREVGSGLDYAHRQGFVHRDVKPENILFADGLAVLADFGIARAIGVAGSDAVTEIGLAVGTPDYMSPEQAAGEQDVGPRSDAFSLAVVAYEMLAGEAPLKGAGPRETMARHISETPGPLRAVRPEVPSRVERALARALARDPADRYPTVAELVAALEDESAVPFTPASAPTIAVLPFVNSSPDPDSEYLSDGITDELIDALAKVEGLRVSSRSSVFALKGKPADVRAIGALLGAAWVLEGSLRRAGNRLRITAQLASTDDGRVLWSERFDRTLEDVFAIQEEIARTIVDTLRRTSLAELVAPSPRKHTNNLSAYAMYLKGRYLWNRRTRGDIAAAISMFEQAIAEDPGYAQAYAGLADAYALSLDYRDVPVAEGFALAERYARQALALDDTVAEAHASLAWSLFIYDWNWDESRREFRRAIELDPGYATARQWYAFWLLARGHSDAGLAEVHRAAELDPVSISIRRSVGWMYYYARRYDEGRYYLERAIAMNPTADETYRVLGLTCAVQGRYEEAERYLKEAIALSPGGTYTPSMLVYMLGRAGRRAEAEEKMRELEARAHAAYVSPVAFATMHLGLGNYEAALDWMEKARLERRGWLCYLRVHPIVDPVRSDPRFAALMKAMGL
jgi:serine/threonine-protein kinase